MPDHGVLSCFESRGTAENVNELLRLFSDNQIKPHIGQRYPLVGAAEVLTHLSESSTLGKIVVTTN
ncbi:zinc-binding dehydrogenase [Ruegeria lacuscaerulensis]|uniref:zinc-binding dehydrogenase n=1 Tax=Ruegeria lacuscaerulensis TaxID=55218 RepID=UPI003AF86F17